MEPVMLEGPLLEGRPVRLGVLDYGLFRVFGGDRVIGLSGFLVETDRGERVVIDTGLPEKYAHDAKAAALEDGLGAFGEVVAVGPENLPLAQLGLLGLGEDDIDVLVTTHTHVDHLGGMHLFPRAPMVMAVAERALPRPLYWGSVQPVAWPERDTRLVAGDCLLGPDFRLLFVPGHAPGQLAAWLELPETGAVLLTSDAISRPAELAEGFAGTKEAGLALHHAERLMRLAGETDAFVIYGHAPEQWAGLRKVPAVYA